MKDLQVETHWAIAIILIIRNPFKLLVHALYRIHKCTYKDTRISSSRYIVDSITSLIKHLSHAVISNGLEKMASLS